MTAVVLSKEKVVTSKTDPKWKMKSFEDMKFKLILINGPNLNMLGKRDPEHYGSFTLGDVEKTASEKAASRGYELICFQSNHEGAIIDKIHESMDLCDGIIINPGAYTHYSYAILDALELCGLPAVEVHISDISAREDFRKISVTSSDCIAQIKGLGIAGYVKGSDILCDTIEKSLDRRNK